VEEQFDTAISEARSSHAGAELFFDMNTGVITEHFDPIIFHAQGVPFRRLPIWGGWI